MGNYKNIEARFLDADERIEMGDFREAKQMLEDIVQEEPAYGRAHNHLGWIFMVKLSDFAKAERHLKLAMRYAPDFAAAFRNYAHLLFLTNRFEQLDQHVERCASIAGIDFDTVLRFQALSLEQRGQLSQARAILRQALQVSVDEDTVEALKRDTTRLRKKMGWIRWLLA